jgi:hypothetical protein
VGANAILLDQDGAFIADVTSADPASFQRLAYQAARLAQREQGWDFPSFPEPSRHRRDTDRHALLYCVSGHLLGFLSTTPGGVFTSAYWSGRREDLAVVRGEPVHRPDVGVIWVAHEWRRSGVASALVRHLAETAGVPPESVAWGAPLTGDGWALSRRFANEDGGLWVA